jgi:hypothetical protein
MVFMNIITFLTSSIIYKKPSSKGEKTLSLLSRYFYLGGKRVTVYDNKEIEQSQERISWKTTTAKVISYIVLTPITVLAYITNLSLRVYYLRGMSLKQQDTSSQIFTPLILSTPENQPYQPSPIAKSVEPTEEISQPITLEAESKITASEAETEIEAEVTQKQIVKADQSQLVQAWLEQHEKDFVAHAIWEGNISKVIQRGAVLPSEAVLKEKGEVEYEMGSVCGARGTRALIELTEEDRKVFTELTEEEETTLKELQDKHNSLSPEERMELKELNKLIFEKLDNENKEIYITLINFIKYREAENIIDNLNETKKLGLRSLSKEQQDRYHELNNKYALKISEKASLKYLERRKLGLLSNYQGTQISQPPLKKIEELEKRYNCDRQKIFISYYLKHNNIYPFLTRKFKKLKTKDCNEKIIKSISQAKSVHHIIPKLNAEIRVRHNIIDWQYGKCVVLRGNPEKIISSQLDTILGTEYLLLRPWENEGEYFTLELAEQDTLLIGPEKDLAPYSEKLKQMGVKFAYLESLSPQQAQFFYR